MQEVNFSGKPWSNAGESQLLNSFAIAPRNEVNTLTRASELSLIEIKIKQEPNIVQKERASSSGNYRDSSHRDQRYPYREQKFRPSKFILNRTKATQSNLGSARILKDDS